MVGIRAGGAIELYTFGPAWALPVPTASPFGLKLITWLKMHGIPFELRIENNPGKGPKKKCPWIVADGQAIGDSEIIIDRLRRRHGVEGDGALSMGQRATDVALRRMLEEHYHQVWEYEVFIHDDGWRRGREFFDQLPPGVRVLVRNLARSGLRKQLYARGVGRHDREQILAMGKADLDSVAGILGDQPFVLGDAPTDLDATVFAFMALTCWTPLDSPLWAHFHAHATLPAYCERMLQKYYR